MPDRKELRALLTAACVLAWLTTAGPIGATHRGDVPDQVALQIFYQQAPAAEAHGQVVARALVDDGSPVVGVEVEFLRELDFLGPRLIRLGSATTDGFGTARMTIDTDEPTVHVRARFMGTSQYLPAEASSEFNVPVGAPNGPDPAGSGGDEPNLAAFATVMPPLLAAIALAIWLVLIGLSAATVLAIRRGRPSTPAQEEKRT